MLVAGVMKFQGRVMRTGLRNGAAWRRMENEKAREAQARRFGGGEHKIGGRSSSESREGVWRRKE